MAELEPRRSELQTPEAINRRMADPYFNFKASLAEAGFAPQDEPGLELLLKMARNRAVPKEDRARAIATIALSTIPSLIERFAPPGVPPEELVSEAYEVIATSIRSYRRTDPNTGEPITFSDYVARSFRERINIDVNIADAPWWLHLSRDATGHLSDLLPAEDRLRQAEDFTTPRSYMIYAIIKDENFSSFAEEDALAEAIDRLWRTMSAEHYSVGSKIQTGEIDPDTLEPKTRAVDDILPERTTESDPAYICGEIELHRLLRDAVGLLPIRDRFVIENRFGLYGPSRTQEEVGKLLGVTKQTIFYAEKLALRRLRGYFRRNRVRLFHDRFF